MATNDNSGFNDYRFLFDARNSRQYAIRFEDDMPKKPIHVFALDKKETGLKTKETIIAFDDDIERKKSPGGSMTLEVLAFQISFDPAAKPDTSVKQQIVTYTVKYAANAGGIETVYTLSPESKADLQRRGFTGNVPQEYRQSIQPTDPGVKFDPFAGKVTLDETFFDNLSFPPHQPDSQAVTARFEIAKMTSGGGTTLTVRPQEKPPSTGVAVRKKFNETGGTAVQAPRKAVKYRVSDAQIEAVIRQYSKDLTALAEQGKLDPVVGRDSETDQALKVLSRRKQSSLCFTGDAGVGKTAMFSGIAQRIVDGENVPESLAGARIVQLDLQAMNAGAKFRGQFEEKLKPLIDGLQERDGILNGRKVILAIDEIHSQLTSGKAEGGTDAGNMMKPFLTSKGISVMGTTTGEEYRKHIEKDGALSSRFEQLVLSQPDEASTKIIMQKLWPLIRDHHGLAEDLADDDLDYIIQMTNRYAPNESQPRKGEKAIDMAAASARFRQSNVIEREDIIAAVAQMSKLSPDFLNKSDDERFMHIEEELKKRVLGQPAVSNISDGLIGARVGLNDPDQPWACYVAQGPTGTGKTESFKVLAELLFGSKDALIKLDMSEYSEKHTVARLIGAPPGYVGFDSAEPALTEQIRQRPYSILLLDEIEKAHPDVFNVFLSVLNDGKITDNHGKTVLFNNVIIVMTTNLGAKEALTGNMGFGGTPKDEDQEAVQKRLAAIYLKARKDFFRPEMVNRIEELGGFLTYIPLSRDVIASLVEREVGKVSNRLSDKTRAGFKDVSLEVSDEIKAQLAKDGYNPAMGARPMRKVVKEKIQNPLAKWLLGHKQKLADFVAENGPAKLVINALPKPGVKWEPEIQTLNAALPAALNDNTAMTLDKATPPGKPLSFKP